MDDAIIASVSSEASGQPAEHAISPLEPNFAWQANEVSAQHKLIIDLTEARECDGFSFIHHEAEDIDITVEMSADATQWISCTLLSYTTPDSTFIRMHYFASDGTNLSTYTARYWRFTVLSTTYAPYYAPTDCRISMCWLFSFHEFDKGAAWPINDMSVYPGNSELLANGKVYRSGYSVNPYVTFTRTWMLVDSEYDVLRAAIRACNGAYRPFVLIESDGVHRLCKFASDEITEELLDLGLYRVTCKFVELPIVQKNRWH